MANGIKEIKNKNKIKLSLRVKEKRRSYVTVRAKNQKKNEKGDDIKKNIRG